ncbi:sulfotransferase family protein [Nocardiopsis ansamitocini]|uniref:Sulfotransferase n=1 Tax=Nocardiopsis ansamitocini TaxID=1670832 RepID=A0A9W6P4E9_9ACTN|nr:sulfotransferase [Nocardiopsis ansamitocini]GLU46902.1 hypothetical protein Nans01_12530 [Nocardiopsis ansamitocini]
MSMPSDHRMVFTGGLHGSGVTLLAEHLARHPEVSLLAGADAPGCEGQHMQSVYPRDAAYGGPGLFAFDPRAHLTEERPLCRVSTAQRLFEQWAPEWDLTRDVLVEKSAPNLIMMRYLLHLYPQARFVMVVRHPVAVALATQARHRDLPIQSLVAHWLHAHELAAMDALLVERLHIVRYEELVTEPERVLAGVGDFLELTGPVPAGGMDAHHCDRYQRQWRSYRSLVHPGRRASCNRMEQRFAERVERFGYRLGDFTALNPESTRLAAQGALSVT